MKDNIEFPSWENIAEVIPRELESNETTSFSSYNQWFVWSVSGQAIHRCFLAQGLLERQQGDVALEV
jgi:hypothetical protein